MDCVGSKTMQCDEPRLARTPFKLPYFYPTDPLSLRDKNTSMIWQELSSHTGTVFAS